MKNQVSELREKRGWGQKDLADQLNISEAAVSRLETGKSKLDNVKLERLCRLFSCTPNDIFNYSSCDAVKGETLKNIILEALKYRGVLSAEQIADISTKAYMQSFKDGMTAQEFRRILAFLPL